MVLDNARKKLGNALDSVTDKAKEYGEKAAEVTKERSQVAVEKVQETGFEVRKKLYNPVFPEDYVSVDFDLPKMIVIVDEDERKGIDVCEGAIGWLSKQAGIEVFHLYEEAAPMSGLHFYPMASCGSVYYFDKLNDKRFINIACYLETVQNDQITELKQIAYKLGAKKCRLEALEEAKTVKTKKVGRKRKQSAQTEAGTVKMSNSIDVSLNNSLYQKRSVVFSQSYEGDAAPQRPDLHWFAHNNEIISLIDMRCSDGAGNVMREYSFKIDNSARTMISANMAGKIDAALEKMGMECNFSLKGEVVNESRKQLVFEIEF